VGRDYAVCGEEVDQVLFGVSKLAVRTVETGLLRLSKLRRLRTGGLPEDARDLCNGPFGNGASEGTVPMHDPNRDKASLSVPGRRDGMAHFP